MAQKRVAIVNGLARQYKYNRFLEKKYTDLGYTVKEYEFQKLPMYIHQLRHKLLPVVKELLDNNDVIHCESGGFVPWLHYYYNNNYTNKLIFDCPVLTVTTGTFLAGTNLSKSYHGIKHNPFIQKFVDTFFFQPEFCNQCLGMLKDLKAKNQALILASYADKVSDISERQEYFHHIFEKGDHGRLFFVPENNFDIVAKFVETGVIDTSLVAKK